MSGPTSSQVCQRTSSGSDVAGRTLTPQNRPATLSACTTTHEREPVSTVRSPNHPSDVGEGNCWCHDGGLMGYTELLLDDVRAQLAPDDEVLTGASGSRYDSHVQCKRPATWNPVCQRVRGPKCRLHHHTRCRIAVPAVAAGADRRPVPTRTWDSH